MQQYFPVGGTLFKDFSFGLSFIAFPRPNPSLMRNKPTQFYQEAGGEVQDLKFSTTAIHECLFALLLHQSFEFRHEVAAVGWGPHCPDGAHDHNHNRSEPGFRMMQLQAWTERLVDIFIHFFQGPSASEPRWYCASLSSPSLALVES